MFSEDKNKEIEKNITNNSEETPVEEATTEEATTEEAPAEEAPDGKDNKK